MCFLGDLKGLQVELDLRDVETAETRTAPLECDERLDIRIWFAEALIVGALIQMKALQVWPRLCDRAEVRRAVGYEGSNQVEREVAEGGMGQEGFDKLYERRVD